MTHLLSAMPALNETGEENAAFIYFHKAVLCELQVQHSDSTPAQHMCSSNMQSVHRLTDVSVWKESFDVTLCDSETSHFNVRIGRARLNSFQEKCGYNRSECFPVLCQTKFERVRTLPAITDAFHVDALQMMILRGWPSQFHFLLCLETCIFVLELRICTGNHPQLISDQIVADICVCYLIR